MTLTLPFKLGLLPKAHPTARPSHLQVFPVSFPSEATNLRSGLTLQPLPPQGAHLAVIDALMVAFAFEWTKTLPGPLALASLEHKLLFWVDTVGGGWAKMGRGAGGQDQSSDWSANLSLFRRPSGSCRRRRSRKLPREHLLWPLQMG